MELQITGSYAGILGLWLNAPRFVGTVGTFTVIPAASVLVILHFAGVDVGIS